MLKYLFTAFVLPPGIFVVATGFAGGWLLVRKGRAAGAACLSLAFLLWATSVTPVSDFLLGGLESPYRHPPEPRGDVIVLLGGGVYEGTPDMTGVGAPSEEMMARMVTAVRLQRKIGAPVIVSGGRVFEHMGAEAPIVGRFLADLGVPGDKILLESESRDTRENAAFSAEFLRKRGYRSPLLVTSAFHMRRAVLSFERAGEKVTPVPSAFRTWEGRRFEWNDYLPNASALRNSAMAIREYIGFEVYRLTVRGA